MVVKEIEKGVMGIIVSLCKCVIVRRLNDIKQMIGKGEIDQQKLSVLVVIHTSMVMRKSFS